MSDSSEDLDDLRDSNSGSSSPVIGQRSKKRTIVKNISSEESGTDTGNHGNKLYRDTRPDIIKGRGTENCHIESFKNESPDNPKYVESTEHTIAKDTTMHLEDVPVSTDMQLDSTLSVEEGLRNKRPVSNDSGSEGSLKVKRRVRSFLSGSSEEDIKKDLKTKKKRRVKRPESDDEIR